MMVNFESFVDAINLKFFGNFTTASSWLIHTEDLLFKKFLIKSEEFFLYKKALPNSLFFFEDLILSAASFI